MPPVRRLGRGSCRRREEPRAGSGVPTVRSRSTPGASLSFKNTIHAFVQDAREPLNALQLQVHLLDRVLDTRRGPSEESGSQLLVRMLDQIRNLDALVAELLRFAQYGRLHKKTLDAGHLLREVFHEVRAECKRLGVTAQLSAPRNLPPLEGDRVQLRQALVYGVLSALRLGASAIRMQVDADQSEQRLSIQITGAGSAGTRCVRPKQPVAGGGMWLPILLKIVHSHGGDVVATPPRAGSSSLCISLPFPAPRGVSDARADDRPPDR